MLLGLFDSKHLELSFALLKSLLPVGLDLFVDLIVLLINGFFEINLFF